MRLLTPPRTVPGFREFVALIAFLGALQALGIDAMLPALPTIGHALGITDETRLQWIIATYIAGMVTPTPKAMSRNVGPSNGWKLRDMPIITPATPAVASDIPLATA